MTYTVIGLYGDGQTYADHFQAADPHEAMRLAAVALSPDDDLDILGAIEGEHQLTAACEDSGHCADARDLLGEDDSE